MNIKEKNQAPHFFLIMFQLYFQNIKNIYTALFSKKKFHVCSSEKIYALWACRSSKEFVET